MSNKIKIGCIGTAGRGPDKDKITPELYEKMEITFKSIINGLINSLNLEPIDITIVSGGAAVGDHISISTWLYRESKWDNMKLELELPIEFDLKISKYKLDKSKNDCGKVSNYYHELFGKKVFDDKNYSLNQIKDAIIGGAIATIGKGFFNRNDTIADKCDIMIAFTFDDEKIDEKSGTGYTMKRFLKQKKVGSYHVDLNDFQIHNPAMIK